MNDDICKTWMSYINNNKRIRSLSIPGTHQSCSIEGCLFPWQCETFFGQWTYTQDKNIKNQLELGIRYLDIRLRHINDSFALHQGPCFLNMNLFDVLNEVIDFLEAYPSETVLLRIKEEYREQGNTHTFEQTMQDYYSKFDNYFWHNMHSYDYDPTLAECRGKIVILQNFNSIFKFGLGYLSSFDIQDEYYVESFQIKKKKIDDCLRKARSGKFSLINNLGAFSTLMPQREFAMLSNSHMFCYISGNKHYVGITVIDYPYKMLVYNIIAINSEHFLLKHISGDIILIYQK